MGEAGKQTQFNRVLVELERNGILLHSDGKLPSVVSIIAGGPVRGSWWGHPKGALIFDVGKHLDTHHDVLVSKLVSGKYTYIHRRLWSEFLSIANAEESWQTDGLSKDAQRLFREIVDREDVRTDQVAARLRIRIGLLGDAARELESRLLVYGEGIHTETGFHAKRLLTWSRWYERKGFVSRSVTPLRAKKMFERLLSRLNRKFEASAELPWES